MTRRAAQGEHTPVLAHPESRPVFVLEVEGRPGMAGVRQICWALKRLLRDLKLRCVSIAVRQPDREPRS